MRLTECAAFLCALTACAQTTIPAEAFWDTLPTLTFSTGLAAFWDVGGRDKEAHMQCAAAHGFKTVGLLNTYTDYIGHKKESIHPDPRNPWKKPPFFEKIVCRNSAQIAATRDLFVHDIEFHFEENLEPLWQDPELRAASGATTFEAFQEAYYQAWATWFTDPCIWAKKIRPAMAIGIYGPQPFRRDYWGVSGGTAQQIDGTHKTDAQLYRSIAPHVDFCIASIYCFYDTPGSVYYMAANVEENAQRMATYAGKKPVYAYTWLRYHDSNKKLAGQELAPYLVEAMAILPYFCQAKGVVLWGWEPKTGPTYTNLPLFMKSLERVARISGPLSRATPDNTEPVYVCWKEKRPIVRTMKISDTEWYVAAINPNQAENASSTVDVTCKTNTYTVPLHGKHVALFQIAKGILTELH